MRPAPLLQHGLERGLGAEEDAGQVGGQHLLPLLVLHPQEQVVAGDPGVVDEVVDPAVGRQDVRHRRLDRGRGRPRRGRAPRPGPRPPRSPPPPRASLAASRAPRTTCAPSAASASRDRAADAARGAGHERDLARRGDPSRLRARRRGRRPPPRATPASPRSGPAPPSRSSGRGRSARCPGPPRRRSSTPSRGEQLDRLLPAHGARDLAHEAVAARVGRRAPTRASTLLTRGTTGSRNGQRRRGPGASRSWAGFMSAQWKGADTGQPDRALRPRAPCSAPRPAPPRRRGRRSRPGPAS